jgi:transposase
LFVGDDWAEAHHDVEVQDEAGRVLVRRRLPEGVGGLAGLHELLAVHGGPEADPAQVVVGIETDRGTWVAALLAAGYQVYAVNPLSAARYRERHVTSGAKSDAGDAHVLAELVRTDRHHHRPIAGDSELAGAIKVLARAHQNLIWARGRQVNVLRSTLREFYPGALVAFESLTSGDALAVLQIAPTPAAGRALSRSKITSALRRGGRQRRLEPTAAAVQAALRADQLAALPLVADAFGHTVLALVRVITELTRQIERLEGELSASFDRHPDAAILRSQPGLGAVLAARVRSRQRYAAVSLFSGCGGMDLGAEASGRAQVVWAVDNEHWAVQTYRRNLGPRVVMVCGQKIALGRVHAHRTVSIHVAETTLAIELDDGQTRIVRRTTTLPVRSIKADRPRTVPSVS